MPLYEYECTVCGLRFERRQHMADDPIEICPECGDKVRRLIQPVGVVFKGKGFYVTDDKKARLPTVAPKASGTRGTTRE